MGGGGHAKEDADETDELLRTGIESNVTYMLLVDKYAASGALPRLMQLIDVWKASPANIEIYPYLAAMNQCGKVGDMSLAKELFADLLAQKLQPNLALMNSFLEALCKAGDSITALRLVDVDMVKYNVRPNVVTFNILIDYHLKVRSVSPTPFSQPTVHPPCRSRLTKVNPDSV